MITQGWPEKTYHFTGEWLRISQGSRQTALRNRRIVWCPVYRADDGEEFIDATAARKSDPGTQTAIDS